MTNLSTEILFGNPSNISGVKLLQFPYQQTSNKQLIKNILLH